MSQACLEGSLIELEENEQMQKEFTCLINVQRSVTLFFSGRIFSSVKLTVNHCKIKHLFLLVNLSLAQNHTLNLWYSMFTTLRSTLRSICSLFHQLV